MAELRADITLVNLLRDAVDASKDDDDGWANLGAVGHFIANRASFDPRNYGYAKLKGLIKEIGLFELREDGLQISIRALPKPKPTAPKVATPKTSRTA